MIKASVSFLPLSVPSSRETHIVADYAELLCLCNPDKMLSLDDLLSRVYKSAELEAERETDSIEREAPEADDEQRKNGYDWFRHLRFRKNCFGEYYPFSVCDSVLTTEETFNVSQLTYIFLLLCSNLRIVHNDGKRNKLTTDFEKLCSFAMERYLPDFKVQCFGKSVAARENYPSKLFDAVNQLAENINERCIIKKEDFASTTTGDGGLDIVGWRRPWINDPAPGSLICFAQCACSNSEWKRKQNESYHGNWSNRIYFQHPTANMMFIPFCFRNNSGKWHQSDDIIESILMDRLRICTLLSKDDSAKLTELCSWSLIKKFLEYKEDV